MYPVFTPMHFTPKHVLGSGHVGFWVKVFASFIISGVASVYVQSRLTYFS